VFLQELEHVSSLASYFREFTAMEYSNPERAASSIDGSTTEEKVSFIITHCVM
jgi:hypothetical protein